MLANTFSIAICSFNPDLRALNRLLNAIIALRSVNEVSSILIVDNCSVPPLSSVEFVQKFLNLLPQARCVIETTPGQTAARCRAILETASDVIIFFDDDNEPNCDYLVILDDAFTRYPSVGIWQPGSIKVEFLDDASPLIRQRPQIYQERSDLFSYGCHLNWDKLSRIHGTGFAVRRKILLRFVNQYKSCALAYLSRTGNSLASSEDLQIVWEAYSLGFAAGTLPSLHCNHLIIGRKSTEEYARRLHFWSAAAAYLALLESFPDAAIDVPQSRLILRLFLNYLSMLFYALVRRQQSFDRDLRWGAILGQSFGLAKSAQPDLAHLIRKIAEIQGYW
ncbi:glycosyltransferase [Synechococcus sp. CBW1107]|uniref:glycosyltransferase n=1 Tax=Synechococcus sp. CBW1107 TaxID=2789857 RepID=UPI002AD4ECAA|nr:glycosyltransferase [Synechococcus sp. CBW1107]CAK6686872.1 hypothetical protein ICNINCKA_00088 [Synechococcus sp. CBW1107]